MPDKNEIITVDLSSRNAAEIERVLNEELKARGKRPGAFELLDLGFDIPDRWPRRELTLANLTTIARKLNLKITIQSLGLSRFEPVKDEPKSENK